MKILLTDGSHMNTLGMMRHMKNHTIDILHHKKSAPAYSRYCNKLVLCPNVLEFDAYADFLISYLKENKYDILITVGVLSAYVCVEHQEEIKKYVRLIVPSKESFDIAFNKNKTYDFCERHGIYHPGKGKYPAVIKGNSEKAGKFPVAYVNDESELNSNLKRIFSENPHLTEDDVVIQEKVVGEPYGFFALYENGVLKRSSSQRRIREYPVTGGIATSAETVHDEELFNAGKEVFDLLQWNGVGMVEYKKTDKGYCLIEINPKFWTSLEMHIMAGMHYPEYLLEDNLEVRTDYKKMKFVWIFANDAELYRLLKRPQDLFKVIWDSITSKTDFHFDDPIPTIIQFLYWVKRLFRKNK